MYKQLLFMCYFYHLYSTFQQGATEFQIDIGELSLEAETDDCTRGLLAPLLSLSSTNSLTKHDIEWRRLLNLGSFWSRFKIIWIANKLSATSNSAHYKAQHIDANATSDGDGTMPTNTSSRPVPLNHWSIIARIRGGSPESTGLPPGSSR